MMPDYHLKNIVYRIYSLGGFCLSRKNKLIWRRTLSVLLTVLVVLSGFTQPALAQESNNITVNTDGAAPQQTAENVEATSIEQEGNVSGKLTQNNSDLANIAFS